MCVVYIGSYIYKKMYNKYHIQNPLPFIFTQQQIFRTSKRMWGKKKSPHLYLGPYFLLLCWASCLCKSFCVNGNTMKNWIHFLLSRYPFTYINSINSFGFLLLRKILISSNVCDSLKCLFWLNQDTVILNFILRLFSGGKNRRQGCNLPRHVSQMVHGIKKLKM